MTPKEYRALMVEPASLMLGWGYGRAPPDLISRACLRTLPGLDLVTSAEPLTGLMLEPAYAFNFLIGPSNKSKNGRAPKGDGGLISRACLRILNSRARNPSPYE